MDETMKQRITGYKQIEDMRRTQEMKSGSATVIEVYLQDARLSP
jgi:hypothetical protein